MKQSNENQINSISIRIGEFIRNRRQQLSMTQKNLANLIGITPQQVQKYESGINSLRIERLIEFSRALQYPLEKFLLILSYTQNNLTFSTLQEETTHFYHKNDPSKKYTKIINQSISSKEIETFFFQFLSLKTEAQKYIIKLIKDLYSATNRNNKKGYNNPS